jgi:DNA-binding transcriptional MocR family regulator
MIGPVIVTPPLMQIASSTSFAPPVPLYRRLASDYVTAMEMGTLQAGERMPSVRELMHRHQVSLSTALQMLRHLEALGHLQARPRVGYFVRDSRQDRLELVSEPDLSQPVHPVPQDPHAHFVGINAHISLLLERGRQAAVRVDLGGCTPPASLFDHQVLNKTVARLLRTYPTLLTQGRSLLANQGNHPDFQQAMARQALSVGIRVAPADVLATTGNSEAVSLALAAVASPGDVVAVESPTYYGLLQVVESLQLKTLEIPCSPRTGLSIEALELAFQTQPRLKAVVVVPELQMPLGTRMPDAHKARLVALCAADGAALIEDDSYGLFVEGSQPVRPLKAWDSASGHVIYCQAFNKRPAPGLDECGPLARPRADAQVRSESQHPDPGSAGGGRAHGLGRAAAPHAQAQAAAQAAARGHGPAGGAPLSHRHPAEPAGRRLVPVAGAARGLFHVPDLHRGAGVWHPHGAGQHVFQFGPLRALHATGLYPPGGCLDGAGRARTGGHSLPPAGAGRAALEP